jgi:F-type H+-transporting ATPase subunit delta
LAILAGPAHQVFASVALVALATLFLHEPENSHATEGFKMSMAIASRYARALSEVLASAADSRAALAELQDFAAAFAESKDLRDVLETPALPLPDKLRVLDAVLTRLGTSKTTSDFLRVLETNYRMNLLPEAVAAFRKIVDERDGLLRVTVRSAVELTDTERQALRQRFERLTGKKVLCEFALDAGLIGGVVAQAASTVYDGSVRGQLDRIRHRLLQS